MITLRVFLSSPADVAAERTRAHEVLEALQRAPAWRGRVHLDMVAWDDPNAPVPMDARHTPQHSVTVHAGRPSDCDLTVVMLWSRLGTPVPPPREGEPAFASGTVWELEEARAAGRPVWIYRCQRTVLLDADDPALDDRRRQRDAVRRFFTQFEGGYNAYDSVDDFARQLGLHVEAELRRRLDAQAAAEADVRDALLEPALLDPASVLQRVDLSRFVGRTWLTDEIDRFVAAQPCGVVVVEAAAGMGKSAFMAHLATTRGWVAHYCELTPGVDGISIALRNLAAQLIRRWRLPSVLLGAVLPCQATRADFLERLLRDAAVSRDRLAPGERIVVAVDALDEAGTPPGQNVVALPRRLPQGVFLVVSARPVQVTLDVDAPRLLLRLTADDPRNQQDAGAFLRATAARPVVAAELQRLGIVQAVFEERLLRISRGVWIYLVHVLHEIEAGERLPLDLDSLPDGIWQYYASYWLAWKRRQPPAWAAVALDLLGTLAAAREELSAAQLADLMPHSAGEGRENAVRALLLDAWAPFLVRTAPAAGEPVFRLYHASLREFLGGRYPPGELTAGEQALGDELAASTQSAHARMADRLWALLPDSSPHEPGQLRGYGVHHLVAHLLAAGRANDVGRLLRTPRRRVQRVAFACDDATETVEESLWYAVNIERGLAEAFAGSVKEWLSARAVLPGHVTGADELFGRHVLASVSRDVERVPPELLRALCESSVWTLEQGLAHIRLCTDAQRRLEFARAVLPLAATSAAVWPFACDIARAAVGADARVELLLLLFDHAAPPLRSAAAAELMHVAVPHRRGPSNAAWAALALHWDAQGQPGLRAQCMRSLADGTALLDRPEAPSTDAWLEFLATEAGSRQAKAALARAGAAVASDPRLEACAVIWTAECRWSALLAAALARPDSGWARQALEGLAARETPPPTATLAMALSALDLLAEAGVREACATWLWNCTAQAAHGTAEDDALFAALAKLRRGAAREALRDASGGPPGDGPFDIVCRWLLAADRAAALRSALEAQALLGDPWRGYVLGALARHGASARACWNASAGITDPTFLAEALAWAAPSLPSQTRRKGLHRLRAALVPRPENDRLEAMARTLQPWLDAAGTEVVEALAASTFDASVTMLHATLLHERLSHEHLEAALRRTHDERTGLVRVLREREDLDEVQALCRQIMRWRPDRRLPMLEFAADLLRDPADVRDLLSTAQQQYHGSNSRDNGRLLGGFHLAGLYLAVRDPLRPDISPLHMVAKTVMAVSAEPQAPLRCSGSIDVAASAALLRRVPVSSATLPFLEALLALGVDALALQGWAPLLGDGSPFGSGDLHAWLTLLRPRLATGDHPAHLLRALLDRCPDDDLGSLLHALVEQATAAVAEEPMVLFRRLGAVASAERRAALLELPWPWPDRARPVLKALRRWWSTGQASWMPQYDAPGRVLDSLSLSWLLEVTSPELIAELLLRGPDWAETGRCDRILAAAFAPLARSAAQRERIVLRHGLGDAEIGWLRWALGGLPAAWLAAAPRRYDDLDFDSYLYLGGDELDKLWRAGREALVVRYLAERAEQWSEWSSYDADMVVPLMDHIEEVNDESLLLALALARFTPRGLEAAENIAQSFDARFAQRLEGRSETFWAGLLRHLADAAVVHQDLVFGSVFQAWLVHAPTAGWQDWLDVVQNRARGEPRARCLAASLRRLAAAGGVESALGRLREVGERLAAQHALACAPGTEPWRHALAPGGLRLPKRQVELYVTLGLALLGAPFARGCIDSGRASVAAVIALPELPLGERLTLLRRHWPGVLEGQRAPPSHPLRMVLSTTSSANLAAALATQPADDFCAELAILVLHCGAAAGDSARPLMQAAWDALLRCLDGRTRDRADDLVAEAAPALGVLFDASQLGRMAADLELCGRWWP